MATDSEEPDSHRNNKHKRKRGRRKLLVDEKVEVRSLEDGFLGSWHSGTVTSLEKQSRHVRYDHLLTDNGTDNLVDILAVSNRVEGINYASHSGNYRGFIRPTPPKLDFGKGNLPYGQCVDADYSEAWWEGVIFDREDGSEERRVFFPDLGDEMKFGIESLRITQDWDELTETWYQRGTWLFLELIEKHEKEKYVPVSVKQLWYDVREKTGFEKIGEWTSSMRPLWEDLVSEVIDDNLRITLNHFLHESDSPRSLQQETELSEGYKHPSEINNCPRSDLSRSRDFVIVKTTSNSEKTHLDHLIADGDLGKNIPQEQAISCRDEAGCLRPQALSMLPSFPDRTSEVSCITNGEELSSAKSGTTDQKAITQRRIGNWQPVDSTIVSGAQFCPNAISDYVLKKGSQRKTVIVKVRKHLKFMGWTIEHMTDESGAHRLRYISPDGSQIQHSLRQVCLRLIEQDETLNSAKIDDSVSPPCDQSIEKTFDIEKNSQLSLPSSSPSDNIILDDGNGLCLEAVKEYLKIGTEDILKRDPRSQMIKLRVKKHLLASGWVFSHRCFGNRRMLQYTCPKGKSVYSLTGACRKYLRDINLEKAVSRPVKNEGSYQGFERPKRKRKSDSSTPTYDSTRKQASSESENVDLNLRRGKTLTALIEMRDQTNIRDGKTGVLRSSKRVQEIKTSGSAHHNPRSILSWLIDNNVVLPRAKVSYCNRKDGSTMKEGKITRDGVKCSCCGKIFTISSFEAHAGSTYRRPAANIYLEDGRSLLDCQVQANRVRKKKKPCDIPKGKWRLGENDSVCSVCHYGGELILCDQCPSSFHKSCLGFEDVPDGDWFCASCCCGICGQIKLKEDGECSTDGKIISCEQCELKYHVGCLPNQGADNKLETNKEGNWFCSKDCKEIFVNLHKLIGKPVTVGVDNLTWTLMKYSESDTCELNASETEALAENHSKLNVALDVMHECFESVKEPHTQRDLVEDVIFSRGSELNRINFRGFYTILLERNDELITVATVRIYGKKIAEMPLIGTRFQYRRLGMCRILMNELEKKLMDLGVESLVLPAVPNVLNTWTNSFGFSKMTDSERKHFLHFTFLDFQDTVMCQKLLIKGASAESIPSRGYQLELQDRILSSKENVDLDVSTANSEVFQAEHCKEGRTEKGLVDASAGYDSSSCEPPRHPVLMEPCMSITITSQGSSFGRVRLGDSDSLKHYKRRKLLGCG